MTPQSIVLVSNSGYLMGADRCISLEGIITVLRKFYLKEERLKCLSKSKQEALNTTSTLCFRNLSNVSSYIFFNAFQSNVRKFLCEIKVKQILARH